jgi:hypothetical protein
MLDDCRWPELMAAIAIVSRAVALAGLSGPILLKVITP